MKRTYSVTFEIVTDLPIEAVKEYLAVYCERMGDVRVTDIKPKEMKTDGEIKAYTGRKDS